MENNQAKQPVKNEDEIKESSETKEPENAPNKPGEKTNSEEKICVKRSHIDRLQVMQQTSAEDQLVPSVSHDHRSPGFHQQNMMAPYGQPNCPNTVQNVTYSPHKEESVVNMSGATNSQIHIKKIIYRTEIAATAKPESESSSMEDLEREFLKLYYNQTEVKTRDKVTATFQDLETPKHQIHPSLRVNDFYKGETAPPDSSYSPDWFYEDKLAEYRGRKIQLNELMDDDVRYAALVGGAGTGKTISARRFARMVLFKQIPSLKHIKLVLYLSIAEVNGKKDYTAYDLIFNKPMGSKVSRKLKEFGFEWMKNHGDEVMLVLDGLDQVNWRLGDEKTVIDYEEKDTVPVIFYNILVKDLFSGCKIVITSREHAVQKCDTQVRPQRMVSLEGFISQDRENLIRELAGSRGEDIWKHLKYKAPGLLALCRTPAYLVFTVAVLMENMENPPDTMSGILIRVLAYFLTSENRRKKSITNVFQKLKKLAFIGVLEKKVIFDESEIKSFGLETSDVSDLIIATPAHTTRSHFKLMEGKAKLFFFHQSIQEALAALYIVDMEIGHFSEIVSEYFHTFSYPNFFLTVQHIVLGVSLNPKLKSHENCDVIGSYDLGENKKEILLKWIEEEVVRTRGTLLFRGLKIEEDDVLCSLLHECGESVHDIISQYYTKVNAISYINATRLFPIISVMTHCNWIEFANFIQVEPDQELVKTFAKVLSKCKHVKIQKFDLSSNLKVDPKYFYYVGLILKMTTFLQVTIHEEQLSRENIEQFMKSCESVRSYAEVISTEPVFCFFLKLSF